MASGVWQRGASTEDCEDSEAAKERERGEQWVSIEAELPGGRCLCLMRALCAD